MTQHTWTTQAVIENWLDGLISNGEAIKQIMASSSSVDTKLMGLDMIADALLLLEQEAAEAAAKALGMLE